MPRDVGLLGQEEKRLKDIVHAWAADAPLALGVKGYMATLIDDTNWPREYKIERTQALTGISEFDAAQLVNFALSRKTNPVDERYTVIGDLLSALIERVDLEDARWIAALIAARGLFPDESLLDNLRIPVPRAVTKGVEVIADYGPEIEWRGPTDDVELQSYLKPEPDYMDIGVLMLVIKRAASVCRIEFEKMDRPATGFLIADDLVLTNYHVLKHPDFPDDDLVGNARDATLYFGKVTQEGGGVSEGQDFKLASDEPIGASPVDKLDYVLLKVEERIKRAKGIEPAPYSLEMPRKVMGLHMIGHPSRAVGEAMQLARSTSGVTGVLEETGLVQYWTRAAGGSSGSPCFNDDWKVVALHHAERSKAVGSRREGILFRSIYEEIKQHLPQGPG